MPFVGAKVKVLLESGKSCGGRLTSYDSKGDWWHIRYADGRKDQVRFPDPAVQITPPRRGSSANEKSARKKSVDSCAAETTKRTKKPEFYAVGCLVRVLFDDGVKYLGKVAQKDASTGIFTIVFEDGEKHLLPLPHADVELADTQGAIEEWEAEEQSMMQGKRKLIPVPWWCNTPTMHSLEADPDFPAPLRWRRLVIKPPAKPKGPRKRRVCKAEEPSASLSANEAVQESVLEEAHPLLADQSVQGEKMETEGAAQGVMGKHRRKRQPTKDRDIDYERGAQHNALPAVSTKRYLCWNFHEVI